MNIKLNSPSSQTNVKSDHHQSGTIKNTLTKQNIIEL